MAVLALIEEMNFDRSLKTHGPTSYRGVPDGVGAVFLAARLTHPDRNLRPGGIPRFRWLAFASGLPFKAGGAGGGLRGHLTLHGAGLTCSPPVYAPPRGVYRSFSDVPP